MNAFDNAFAKLGYPREPHEYDRFGIRVLDENLASAFIDAMRPNQLHEQELTGLLRQLVPVSGWFDVDYLFPKLLIDFDQKTLDTMHVDGINYDYYVPERWIGRTRNFYDEIPVKHRYWVDDSIDCFKEPGEKMLQFTWITQVAH
jgi:hypothetical protein